MKQDENILTCRANLAEALRHRGDPAVVRPLAWFARRYPTLDAPSRLAILRHLAEDLEVRPPLPEPPKMGPDAEALLKLRAALVSPRVELLREFVNVPEGIKFLVDLRAELLEVMREHKDLASLRLLDADLLDLFRGWFNFGFLRLVRIAWDATPAAQLEKLMAYDAVHPMTSWDDLRSRLDKDRACYAFYHPNMPDEPVVFVEIALTRTIASSIDRIMAPRKDATAAAATTAIFYSINSTQPGLAGVSLGNSLIKNVVEELRRRNPNLKRFSTLSPIPTFRGWVEKLLAGEAKDAEITAADAAAMFDGSLAAEALRALLTEDAWAQDAERAGTLKAGLLRLAHHYLTKVKRKGSPADPVANFHLRNGATLYNLNFLSNTRPKGMGESYGVTVNYWYDLATIESNQESFREGRVAITPQLERLVALGVGA